MGFFRRGLALSAFLLHLIPFAHGYGQSVKATGNTVSFQVNLTWEDSQPAGISRKMILSNGQFPAPALNLKQGDDVEFLILTLAVPGIEQHNTPWSDGHAHTRGQQEDGLYGAIHILPDEALEKPFSLISDDQAELEAMEKAESKSTPIFLSDVRALTAEELWEAEIAMGRDAVCANALLVNGKGSVTCLGQETLDQVTTTAMKGVLGNQSLTDIGCLPPTNSIAQGTFAQNISAIPPTVFSGCVPSQGLTEHLYANATQTYVSYDFISAAFVSSITYSIDEHPMYVYAVDGEYIEPILVGAITITNGARYSVLVKLDKPAGGYTIRLANSGVNQVLQGTALMTYKNGGEPQQQPSEPSIDLVGALTSPNYTLLNESLVVPLQAHNVAHVPVAQTRAGRENLTIATQNGTWVDIIFDVTNPLQPPHPIHKHSNKFFVTGQGESNSAIPESFNFGTPQIRDSYATLPAATGPTWLAIRYHVVNPGAFLLHCHIQIHQSGGMAIALLNGIDEWPEIPEEYQLVEDKLERRFHH
ncbi:Cupredoxin [Aspergillus venezuelensis]